jgi:hypothetical protein
LEAQSFGDKAGINRLFTDNRKKTGWIAADVNYAIEVSTQWLPG